MGAISQPYTRRDIELLYETARIATESRDAGNHPFGALLADPQGKILMEKGNEVVSTHNDCGHAETMLLMSASKAYDRAFLATCSLYTSIEPCAMCTGALYWSNVGRLVYALTEERLLEMTGSNPENPTFNLPCRVVLDHGQKDIVVVGPVEDADLEDRIVADHIGFWD
ncbi:MAG: tRNA-specific adenosine deaminase [Spirochaetae bacterium HGW-Spirochaetae-8]|jgi:tRNA(Arg) A34 adenosine deaminase TadA|nr:MAG: tRNA-specific adenosine deaminase [Spirochaetae bacterium HGW-Spirochaetae-8]